ncbi:MAG: FAD-dependent oxidoreductase [Opitutales bacterium]
MHSLIIGGGFFGLYVAEFLARRGHEVTLCELGEDFMQRASYTNQARVHNGYHYPRSVLTALRSRISFPRFTAEFPDCVCDTFEKYYLIGKILGKVTATQFLTFCQRIGAPCEPAHGRLASSVNPRLIEAVFATVESAFNTRLLKARMCERVDDAGVDCRLSTEVCRVAMHPAGGLEVTLQRRDRDTGEERLRVDQVFNCTYSMINRVLDASTLELIPLKHEMTEMCLVRPPQLLRDAGLTVMCGPFFSVMPFPDRGLHSFSHVRYTPHYEWHDQPGQPYRNAYEHFERVPKQTHWRKMVTDAQRYLPILGESDYQDSLWEVKTVLPRSEVDDSRPILFRPNVGLEGFHCIMGGKIDNVYDALDVIQQLKLS